RSGAPVLPMGAASVDALLARARAAGARITVQGLPEPRRLQDFGGEQVTRVLQEAITNASRHAPGTPIDITAADVGAELRLKIENALGETPADAHTAGTGLSTLKVSSAPTAENSPRRRRTVRSSSLRSSRLAVRSRARTMIALWRRRETSMRARPAERSSASD